VHTELGRSQVEVQVGKAEVQVEVDEARRTRRKSAQTLIKSNNPHLAGGEQAGLYAYPLMAKGCGLYTVCNYPSAVGLPSFSSWSNNVKSRFRWKKKTHLWWVNPCQEPLISWLMKPS